MAKLPIFITGNQHKANYLARILGIPLRHQSPDLDEIQSLDPQEVVVRKAKQAYEIYKEPVLVEDTALFANALNGLPGPFLKFFVTVENGKENFCKMLNAFDDRSAYITATYAYYDGKELQTFTGRLDGSIAASPRGTGGYGSDSVFEPEGYGGRTRAELSPEEDDESYQKIRDFDGLRAFLLK